MSDDSSLLPDHSIPIRELMDLTPVPIRGRKRKYLASILTQNLNPKSESTSAASSRSSSKSTSGLKPHKSSKKKKKDTKPAMPTLSGLPTELLEIIFLYSMNPSLPHSSPSLGAKLSSHTICLEFFMRAFFHTVDHRTVARDRRKTSDPHLQSTILSCRFFTYDFFLKYVERAHDAMVKLRGKAWEKTGVEVKGVREFEGLWPFQFTKIPYLGFAEGFFVPEKLLHGPFGKSKSSLLYVLTSLNGEIDWKGSLSGETAKQGMRDAIREGDERAIASLSVLLGVPGAMTTEMLRFAVVECGCEIYILRHLLFNAQILARDVPKDVLDFHDPRLWAWAEKHGEKGEVLKDMLRKADAFDLEFYFEGDVDWKSIVPFPYSGSKFDTRTVFSDLVRELLVNLYRNCGRKITRRPRATQRLDAVMDDVFIET